MDLETHLRSGLSARAADIDEPPPGLLDDVLTGHRRSVHRRRAVLVAAVVAAVVVVGVPVGARISGPGDRSGVQAPATSAFQRYPYEPRGSLSSDTAYVDGLLARDWWPASIGPQPPVETRQVVFAGQVPGGVMALVTGWLDGVRTGQWLAGPVGATAEQLTPIAEPVPVVDSRPQSFTNQVDRAGALVVVAAPGDTVEVLPRQDITASGDIVRAPYAVVGGPDGTAVVDLTTVDPATFGVRVIRDGVVQDVAGGGAASSAPQTGPDLGPALADAAGDPDPDLVRQLVQGVLERTGLDAQGAPVDVVWGGAAGNRAQEADAAVVTVGLPSGATVLLVGAAYGQQAGGDPWTSISTCGQVIEPAGTPTSDRLVVARCDLSSIANGASLGSQVLVVPPVGTTRLQLTGAGGVVIDTRDLVGPAYVGPAPDGVGGAVALDADGRVLARAPLLGVQPLQLD